MQADRPGVFQLQSIGSLTDWRMLFLVDGIITMGVGIMGYFLMTNSAETAKWLNAEERALHAVRIKSGNVGTTVTVDAIHSQSFWQGIFHIQAWLCGLMFLLNNIVVQGIAVFLPTIIVRRGGPCQTDAPDRHLPDRLGPRAQPPHGPALRALPPGALRS